MQDYIKIHQKDNVAVVIKSLMQGGILNIAGKDIVLLEDIPQGHKFALENLKSGDAIIKYGYPIGYAKEDIGEGGWIHTHNVKTGLGEVVNYTYEKEDSKHRSTEEAYFQGYQRANGKVGVRNEIWIIPTVGCVNNVVTEIEKRGRQLIHNNNIEEIVAFTHPYGCSQMGDDQENTKIILADLVNHPNAGGVLVLGLGCENSGVEDLKKYIGEYDEQRVKFLVAQECEDEMEEALKLIEGLIEYASGYKRETIPSKELIIGLKCGGSDGLSGITANPAVGAFSDILISKGGTTILTEVPEMFGAETQLMNRCENAVLFEKTVEMINDFKNYYINNNQTIYENPSPGNKKGGISTLEDKSLGCIQKSGSAQIKGVLKYGEEVSTKGLNLLSAPGNDLVASTALAASGAHIVLFTTGRGTPFSSPVPTVKISSNSTLSEKKSNWIDFNCGRLLEGVPMDILSQEMFEYVLGVASGEKVKAEIAGYHDMAIFKQGVTL